MRWAKTVSSALLRDTIQLMTSGDLSITESGSVRAHFQCDGNYVSIDFYYGEKLVGTHDVYTRAEAVEVAHASPSLASTGIFLCRASRLKTSEVSGLD